MSVIGVIRTGSRAYIESLDVLSGAYRSGTLAVFAGAGISIPGPSCVLGGAELRDQLVGAMVHALRKHGFPLVADNVPAVLGRRPLELILDAFVTVHGRDALGVLSALDAARWNKNHYCIARLLRGKTSTRFITLNFDVLVEAALDELRCGYTVRCPLGSDLVRRVGDEVVQILKPHGSFALPGDPRSVDHLATTLSEIRDRPDERTAAALSVHMRGATSLLVVGYRGEDWDVLPLLDRLRVENPSVSIVWVQYERSLPQVWTDQDSRALLAKLTSAVQEQRRLFGDHFSLLAGDPAELLSALVTRHWPNEERSIPSVTECGDITNLMESPFLSPTVHTALVAAHALQDVSRDDTDLLLERLGQVDFATAGARFQQAWANLAAWRSHIRGDYTRGIELREQALTINRGLGRTDAELAHDIIAAGYQHLSYAKPRRSHLRSPGKALRHWWTGRRLLARGAAAGTDLQRGSAAYYTADYRHAFWMPLLLLGHHTFGWIRRLIFKSLVCAAYQRAAEAKAHLVDREYFVLRRLEALAIAGTLPTRRDEIEAQLRQVESYFVLTRQIDHLRNLCATRALLAFAADPNAEAVDNYLECALLDKDGITGAAPISSRVNGMRCDTAVSVLVSLIAESRDRTTLTPSAVKRYSLFLRYLRPHALSFREALRRAS